MPQSPQPSFLTASLLVAFGGAAGSWLRLLVGRAWVSALGPVRASAFPWGTLSVNIAGSVAMGLLVGCLARLGTAGGLGGEAARLMLAVGLLGGFTTFSSFSLEVVAIIERGQPAVALLYAVVSLAAGIMGLWLTLLLMRATA